MSKGAETWRASAASLSAAARRSFKAQSCVSEVSIFLRSSASMSSTLTSSSLSSSENGKYAELMYVDLVVGGVSMTTSSDQAVRGRSGCAWYSGSTASSAAVFWLVSVTAQCVDLPLPRVSVCREDPWTTNY